MDKIKISQFSITIPAQVGAINKIRKDKLDELLITTSEFTNSVVSPVGLIYLSKNNDTNLVIGQDRISYTKLSPNFDDEIIVTIKKVFKMLLLDESINVSMDMQGTTDNENSHSDSVNRFNLRSDNLLKDYKFVYGVGYRFLIQNNEALGEFKIEPLIVNKTKYFYQYTCNLRKTINIDKLNNVFCSQMNFLTDNLQSIGEKL